MIFIDKLYLQMLKDKSNSYVCYYCEHELEDIVSSLTCTKCGRTTSEDSILQQSMKHSVDTMDKVKRNQIVTVSILVIIIVLIIIMFNIS